MDSRRKGRRTSILTCAALKRRFSLNASQRRSFWPPARYCNRHRFLVGTLRDKTHFSGEAISTETVDGNC
eukprot:2791888-Pleurochrysis_carterae.AAC.1